MPVIMETPGCYTALEQCDTVHKIKGSFLTLTQQIIHPYYIGARHPD